MKKIVLFLAMGIFFLSAVAIFAEDNSSDEHKHKAPSVATEYPDELKQKITALKNDSFAKKEMPAVLSDIHVVSGEEAMKMLKGRKTIFLDSRLKTQYETERIPKSDWFLSDELFNNPAITDKMDKEKDYVVYCSSVTCWRSPAVALMLNFLGFKKVHWYRDGMQDWKNRGYITE